MLVYHFVPANHGLENIHKRRLKISTIPDLNDPFELLCADLSDPDIRKRLRKWKEEMSSRFGLLCFSKTWRNPVQWSHYADRHQGLALGFEIESLFVKEVVYSHIRSKAEALELLASQKVRPELAMAFASTKFAHWHYEQEVRAFTALPDKDPESDLYFFKFGEHFKLKEVLVGAESAVSRADIAEALGPLSHGVLARKVRLAFSTYRVVNQRDQKIWT